MDQDTLLTDLRAQVALGNVVIIAGTGVAILGCRDQRIDALPVARWDGLLRHGIEYGLKVEHVLDAEDAEVLRRQVQRGTPDFLLSAAEVIAGRLRAKSAGTYHRWLKDTVGKLEPTSPELLRLLAGMAGILATLNYDALLEKATGRSPVTWQQADKVEEVLRGARRDAVLHLHGYYDEPNSVILGATSYARIVDDAHSRTLLQLLTMDRTLLFVGCGGTVSDPNFSALIHWAREARAKTTHRHFLLCREEEQEKLRDQLQSVPWLHVISYGPDYAGLLPFVRKLSNQPGIATGAPVRTNGAALAARSGSTERALIRLGVPPFVFQRPALSAQVIDSLTQPQTAGVAITGLAGTGKTVLAREVVSQVGAQFDAVLVPPLTERASLEPAYFLEEINTLLVENGRGISQEALSRQNAERATETLLAGLSGLRVLLVLDGADPVPQPWIRSVCNQVANITGVKFLMTSRDRILDGGQVPWLPLPLLSEDEARHFTAGFAAFYRIRTNVEEAMNRLPVGMRSHPQALATFLAQLQDFPLEVLIPNGVPELSLGALPLIERVVTELPPPTRRVLWLLAMLGGCDLADALETLKPGQPRDLMPVLKGLLDRSLIQRVDKGYLVPELIVSALLRHHRDEGAEIGGEAGAAWKGVVEDGNSGEALLRRCAMIGARLVPFFARLNAWPLIRSAVSLGALDRLNLAGHWKEYSVLLRVSAQAAAELNDRAGQLAFAFRLVRKQQQVHDLEAAEATLKRAERLVSDGDSRLEQAELHSHRALVLHSQGHREQAQAELVESRRIREDLGDHAGLATVDNLIGNYLMQGKQLEAARGSYAQASVNARNAANWVVLCEAETSKAMCDLLAGDAVRAEQAMRELLREGLLQRYPAGAARGYLILARALEAQGKMAEAAEMADLARKHALNHNETVVPVAQALAARLCQHERRA